MDPKFPLYIVSKGRWDSRLTSRHLEAMKVPYRIIVERDEYKNYCDVISPKKVLILDPEYQRKYDLFTDLGSGGTGSGPARNFAWDHSISEGHKWHWVMDDNIRGFYRLHQNLKLMVADGTIFRCMEDFVLRYENIGMAGPCYYMFVYRKKSAKIQPALIFNTRIYSCNLIRNDIGFRWRGRYNEDTDLSLRILKAGWCTVEFQAFQQNKAVTQSIKGGNTDTIYKSGTLAKSKMLVYEHPDVTRLVLKYGRWHHQVNYKLFKNQLKLKPDLKIRPGIDDYGMQIVEAAATI